MQATALDADLDCPVCGGTGDAHDADLRTHCPHCEGTGEINRYRDGEDGHVVLTETYEVQGSAVVYSVEQMPIRDEGTGGFEGRYGDWTPQDVDSGPMAEYQPDTRDRLRNQPLGTSTNASGEYEMPDEPPYGGSTFDERMFPDGWPTGPDLSADEVVAWLTARGDTYTASVFEDLREELDL